MEIITEYLQNDRPRLFKPEYRLSRQEMEELLFLIHYFDIHAHISCDHIAQRSEGHFWLSFTIFKIDMQKNESENLNYEWLYLYQKCKKEPKSAKKSPKLDLKLIFSKNFCLD